MIVLGVPTLGMVSIEWMTRLFKLRVPPNTMLLQDYVVGKDVGIAEKRNRIVASALTREEAVSHVFFVDDDVLFQSDVLLTLMSHARPIVSGLYFQKSPLASPLLWAGPSQGTADWTPDSLQSCWAHGMGLTLIQTEVFRAMQDQLPLGVDDHGHPAWFRTRDDLIDGIPVRISEDVDFLDKAQQVGYQPAVDTSKEAFGWHFDSQKRTGYPASQWKEYCATGTVTWPTAKWELHG